MAAPHPLLAAPCKTYNVSNHWKSGTPWLACPLTQAPFPHSWRPEHLPPLHPKSPCWLKFLLLLPVTRIRIDNHPEVCTLSLRKQKCVTGSCAQRPVQVIEIPRYQLKGINNVMCLLYVSRVNKNSHLNHVTTRQIAWTLQIRKGILKRYVRGRSAWHKMK